MSELAIPLPPDLVRLLADLVERELEERVRREYMSDPNEVAAYLAMGRERLDKLCSGAIVTKEQIPFVREGGRRLFVRQELDRWIDSGGAELA